VIWGFGYQRWKGGGREMIEEFSKGAMEKVESGTKSIHIHQLFR